MRGPDGRAGGDEEEEVTASFWLLLAPKLALW